MELIKLGNHSLPVVAQRHARLRHYLTNTDFTSLLGGNYGHESYRLLGVLVPVLPDAMPEWEWEGYGSEEAWQNSDYVEDMDRSPTTEEIVVAFETVLKVNGAGRLGKIMDMVKLGMQASAAQVQTTPSLQDSLGGNGASTSSSTGPSNPTASTTAG